MSLAAVATTACDWSPLETFGVEERLRTDPDRPGKVGAVRAVAMRMHAADVASDISVRPHPSCSLRMPSGPVVHQFELDMRRTRRGDLVSRWTETRRWERDVDGHRRLEASATFLTREGLEGERSWERRRVGDDLFVSDGRDELFYRRDPDGNGYLFAAGPGTLDRLLSTVGGWKRGGEGGWNAGDEMLACGPTAAARADEENRWRGRFLARSELLSASLSRRDGGRHLSASWRLNDGTTLTLTFSDHVAPFEGDVEAPASERLVDVVRDRSIGRVTSLLERLAEEGTAVKTKQPTEQSGKPHGAN